MLTRELAHTAGTCINDQKMQGAHNRQMFIYACACGVDGLKMQGEHS